MIKDKIIMIEKEIDNLIYKNNNYSRISANHLSYEFSYWLNLLSISNKMEYSELMLPNCQRKSRFDILIFKDNKPSIIIEVKNRNITKNFTDLKQLKRYSEFGLPVVLLENVNEVKNCLTSIIKYLKSGKTDKYFIYK